MDRLRSCQINHQNIRCLCIIWVTKPPFKRVYRNTKDRKLQIEVFRGQKILFITKFVKLDTFEIQWKWLVFISSKCFISSKASFHPSLHFIQLGILDEMRHLDEMKLLDEMKHHNFGPREKWWIESREINLLIFLLGISILKFYQSKIATFCP